MNTILEIAKKAYDRISKLGLIRDSEFTSIKAFKDGAFGVLIATILSQNTSDRNSILAYNRLKKTAGMDPCKIYRIPKEVIAKAIKPAGLYNKKAIVIIEISRTICIDYNGSLEWVRDLDIDTARSILLKLPGIGFKTADILLAYYGFKTFPVDTHITRITKRLGLVPDKAGYDDISNVWMKALPPKEYFKAHLTLISFGRSICKAKNPKCNICPIRNLCKHYIGGDIQFKC